MRSRILGTCSFVVLMLTMHSVTSAQPRRAVAGTPGNADADLIQPLGKGLAKALESAAFRARIADELSDSPYVEGRIPLKRLMTGDVEVRDEILRQADLSQPWEKLATRLPELELYFPFRIHHEAWAGDAAIQVAVATEVPDAYRISATDGSTWLVRGANPPSVPTLLLGPSEIDYDDEESALVGGIRTGGYLFQRALELGLFQEQARVERRHSAPLTRATAESGSGVDQSRHTYLTYFRVPENHDPFKGSMEIEVFGSVDGIHSGCQRFTDIGTGDNYLPAPGASGSRKIAFAVPTGANTVDVTVYEDDDTGCVAKSGDDYLGVANLQITHFDGIYGTSNGEAWVRVGTQNTTCPDSECEGDENGSNCCSDCAGCGNGLCEQPCESNASCRTDCPLCGDSVCGGGESSLSCCQDCGAHCGNGVCQTDCGESEWTCPTDCGSGGSCGDSFCDVWQGECASNCPQDCTNGEFCQ